MVKEAPNVLRLEVRAEVLKYGRYLNRRRGPPAPGARRRIEGRKQHPKGSMDEVEVLRRTTTRKWGHHGRLGTYIRRARVILTDLDEYGCTNVADPRNTVLFI